MLKNILFSLSFIAVIHAGNAQQVVTTAGNFGSGSQGTLSWTMGEPIIETVTGSNEILTQGFQQDFESFVGISDLTNDNQFIIYPNPFHDALFVQTSDQRTEYRIYIRDIQSKLIREINISLANGISTYELDLSSLNAGVYFLTLQIGDHFYSVTQQIIKLHENL